MLNAQAAYSTTRAVIGLGAKNTSQIPKPLVIPSPNQAKREALTRHDFRKALTPPRR